MILFLDFDGVTHRYGGPVFEHADRLVDLLREFPRVDIVLSTSWREIYPYEDLRRFLGDDLTHRIIGKTPVITQREPPYLPHVRHREIKLWLQRHTREAKRGHVILDDEQVLFPTGCPELILCDPRTGIDDRVVGSLRGLKPRMNTILEVRNLLQRFCRYKTAARDCFYV